MPVTGLKMLKWNSLTAVNRDIVLFELLCVNVCFHMEFMRYPKESKVISQARLKVILSENTDRSRNRNNTFLAGLWFI